MSKNSKLQNEQGSRNSSVNEFVLCYDLLPTSVIYLCKFGLFSQFKKKKQATCLSEEIHFVGAQIPLCLTAIRPFTMCVLCAIFTTFLLLGCILEAASYNTINFMSYLMTQVSILYTTVMLATV